MNKSRSIITINPKVFLLIYAAMPLSLLFIGVDFFILGGSIQQSLPVDPRIYAWFILLFMVPHILASFFSFAEKEYIQHYKKRLLRGAQIAVMLGLFLPAFAGGTFLPVLVFATYTMVHVFMQQSGVSKSLMRNNSPSHVYWQLLGITISTIIYTYLLVPLPLFHKVLNELSGVFTLVTLLVLTIYTLFAARIVGQSRTKLGKIYFLGTHAIPILGILYILSGYPILALVVPRIIHDITAFTFYITHDNNRYYKSPTNLLYRFTSRFNIPVYIASPLVAILLALVISKFNSATLTVLLTSIFFLHYYTESIIWKRDTLHRAQIEYTSYS